STVQIKFVENTDHTTRGLCNPVESTIDYSIHSWSPTVRRPRNEQNFSSLDPYFFEFNNSWTFVSDQESCANHIVIDEFIRNCDCLPYLLPIPTKYRNIPDCFYLNSSDPAGIEKLQLSEFCAVKLFTKMETLIEKHWAACKPNCRKPHYSVQL
uniref:HYR domain-containing protein n=1 Tax=Macrostomum lignano TaxID=282301 RepID=A0A1I8GAS4_9PLAT